MASAGTALAERTIASLYVRLREEADGGCSLLQRDGVRHQILNDGLRRGAHVSQCAPDIPQTKLRQPIADDSADYMKISRITSPSLGRDITAFTGDTGDSRDAGDARMTGFSTGTAYVGVMVSVGIRP